MDEFYGEGNRSGTFSVFYNIAYPNAKRLLIYNPVSTYQRDFDVLC